MRPPLFFCVPPSSRKNSGGFAYGLLKLFSAFRLIEQTAVVSAIRPECLMAHSAVFWLSGPRGSQKPLNNVRNIPLFHRFEKATRFLRVTVALFNPLKSVVFLNSVKKMNNFTNDLFMLLFSSFPVEEIAEFFKRSNIPHTISNIE